MSKHLVPTVAKLVDGMTNWERNNWMAAGRPGARSGSVDEVEAFLAGLPRRFERHVFSLATFGSKKLPMRQILRGRTGIRIERLNEGSAVVEATARMIDRLVGSFRHCLTAEIHQPSGE